uniref:Uncharacterized protein n=1 Tax=Anguilla anguilla TaxID=7936 RepID=A0A0E9XFG6_ANGAN
MCVCLKKNDCNKNIEINVVLFRCSPAAIDDAFKQCRCCSEFSILEANRFPCPRTRSLA